MNLDVEKLRLLGVPEEFLALATGEPSRVFKEKRRKVCINCTPRFYGLYQTLCFLEKVKPTAEAARAVEFHAEQMAARIEQRMGEFQGKFTGAFGGPSQRPPHGAKGKRATRR